MSPTVRSNRFRTITRYAVPLRPLSPVAAFPAIAGAAVVSAAALGVLFAAATPARADDPPDPVAAALNSASFPLPGLPLIADLGSDTAIVVLGYGLQPDGQMQPELIDRLSAAHIQAVLTPAAPVVVTGGNPEGGVTEAQVMADWLVGRGIPPDRVHLEDRAESTLENAEYSAAMMDSIGAHSAVLVTSSDHMYRARGDFADAGIPVVATLTPDQAPESVLPFGPPP
ncbi:YdcF family protein [Nocardia sp. BMG51109]|uniref:YdcF family protein n=1 Tax=Nocardia sp. BMG51109 TaxID=1056816 RepID=UPI0004B985C8|nr:YdcF family protein [Nocardia sp. BMG51109]